MTTFTRSDTNMVAHYSSLEEATKAEKDFAMTNGYCLRIQRTNFKGNKLGGEIKNRTMTCVHSDSAASQAHARNTSIMCQNCPFYLRITRNSESGDSWSSQIINAEHNHEAAENIAAYPAARALTDAEIQTVHSLSSIGAKPRVVIGALRQQNPGNLTTAQDIYNVNKYKKRKMLDGRSEIEALLDTLIARSIKHTALRNNSNNLTCLFIVPKSAENIIKHFSDNKVYLIDSTYKTNQYKMPLLHGTGVTAINKTFTIFYCFMRYETEELYTWAMWELRRYFDTLTINSDRAVFVTDREIGLMNALSTVFPSSETLLCIWHINKNVLAKHRSSFDSEDAWKAFMELWQAVINSMSVVEYDQRLDQLSDRAPAAVFEYLSSTWLCHKEKFILAWIKNVKHFGHVTTSRVESAHAALKKWLQVSTGDMLGVCLLLERACEEQDRSISQTSSFQRTHNLTEHSHSIWKDVKKHISFHALKLAREQYHKSLAPPDGPCTNTFTSTMGIPCSHNIRKMLADPLIAFTIDDFDNHWWLKQPDAFVMTQQPEILDTDDVLLQLRQRSDLLTPHQRQIFLSSLMELAHQDFEVLNPVIAATRGRPRGSTRRNPSAFEYVEQSQQGPLSQTRHSCRICNMSGHNARTCPRNNATDI